MNLHKPLHLVPMLPKGMQLRLVAPAPPHALPTFPFTTICRTIYQYHSLTL